jgi:tryptophan synthase alpha chain
MSRIAQTFENLKKQKRKALIAYITAGYPTLAATKKLVLELEKRGADIIELGVPFSDPLADGPTIQYSSQEALKKGASLEKILALVKDLRKKTQIPLVLMTYYNPVFHLGLRAFAEKAQAAGVDGVIVPDLPPDEGQELITVAYPRGLDTIFLLAPTSTEERVALVSQYSRGFIYYVSVTGVTGARQSLPRELKPGLNQVRAKTSLPLCVGFGISTPSQAKELSRVCDGVIIGSAIVNIIRQAPPGDAYITRTGKFIAQLRRALD